MMRHRRDISATANADGNDKKVRVGGDLFQEGMDGNIEHWDVRSPYHVVIPTNLALERCFPVSELNEGHQPTPSQRHPVTSGKGWKSKGISPKDEDVDDITNENDHYGTNSLPFFTPLALLH